MKVTILFALLVPSISAAVLPARHTLNELCFHISARSSPWDGEAEEVPLGPEFDGDFCLDNRFKSMQNKKGQHCSMDAPNYRFVCNENRNGTTRFEITYPAADGLPYLTYDSAPGIFYACPADSDPEYTFDLFSAKVPFGSVCMPVTLTLEPAEKSCPGGNSTFTSTTFSSSMSMSSTTSSSAETTTIDDSNNADDGGNNDEDSSETLNTDATTIEQRTTTTSQSSATGSITGTSTSTSVAFSVNSRSTTSSNGALLTSSFGRPMPLPTISNSDGSTTSTPEGRGNATSLATGTTSAPDTKTMPPVLFVPTTTSDAVNITDEPSSTDADSSSTPARICSVPTSAPSIAPWRVGSSTNTPAFNDFDGTGEAALTDKNSTVFEYVIPANFGVSTSELMGFEGVEDINETADPSPSISGNGLCALQFRLPFCNNLPNGYPCYSFSGTTQEVKDNAGVLFSLLHNGGSVKWDDEAMHQLFPGKNTILGTFDCKDIGGGEVGDRTMSWVGSTVKGLGLEFMQAGIAESDFEDGVGAWVVACQD